MKTLTILAVVAFLSACSHAPNYKLYEPPSTPGFANRPDEAAQEEPAAEFWRGFQDAQLDALVARALGANADLRIAGANLREARALAQFAEAQLLPAVDVAAGAGRVRAPDAAGNPRTNHAYAVGFDVNWEVDLFGRLGDERRAAVADVTASEAGLHFVHLSVSAEVARIYFELRGLQERLRVAYASLETRRSVLELVKARHDAGRGTAFDAERARVLVQSAAASVPALEAAVLRARYRLSRLCGEQPTALDVELSVPKPLPGLKSVALGGIGSPESLLRRRPDILAAEQQAAAAAARVGVARAELFPRITLGGTIGQNALTLGNLGDGASYAYSLGARMVWNLLDFGRIRARIAAADARGDAAMLVYERTVLTALEEAEGALATYTRSQRQAEHLYDAARAAESAALIARERFTAGVSDFLPVLDAEREMLSARDQLAQAQTAAATSLVGVYKALGGGWPS
ncbi:MULTISPECIES: TolC family protein [unclassified Variovorax]|uniref:efflux transporter outer membrane subunit n=1 Tax=unclassified Variovorax TaxID=663243 RepID=UPI00076DDAC7|nr:MULTISPECIES: TolC family protein [unclassified Variovorax]KWT64510.1 RND efflux system, outer membrane lipoprotein CmeC [Variovorax sp. WDL1]PNG56383.1 Toluene efflux pump outer membrane protein TtgI [Variovorax sp. B4]PNG57807.1 Toluene efflux pump outer membrane protein TtgI [Variovorax sp. B2]VTV09753.1 Toluene efflux pump outer membrane protein TtgI precursor [Variovorax sp. WDL1]